MRYEKARMRPAEERRVAYTAASVEQQRADIDYIAIMAGVELESGEEVSMDGGN